jgi:hypothetical protein
MGKDDPEEPGMHKLLELWTDTEFKVRALVFYRRNPGVVETLEGLARRLATPPDSLEPEIRDHVELGILKERHVGEKTVYVFDRSRWRELEGWIEAAVHGRTEGDAAG